MSVNTVFRLPEALDTVTDDFKDTFEPFACFGIPATRQKMRRKYLEGEGGGSVTVSSGDRHFPRLIGLNLDSPAGISSIMMTPEHALDVAHTLIIYAKQQLDREAYEAAREAVASEEDN